jgi:hypothetical protein
MDAIRSTIREHCPHTEFVVIGPEAIEREMDRCEPHLLVCEPPIPKNRLDTLPASLEFSINPTLLHKPHSDIEVQ